MSDGDTRRTHVIIILVNEFCIYSKGGTCIYSQNAAKEQRRTVEMTLCDAVDKRQLGFGSTSRGRLNEGTFCSLQARQAELNRFSTLESSWELLYMIQKGAH